MTTMIRASAPRELLAYVPFRLGYRPEDSVVLVSLRAPRGRVGLVARVDIDDLADLEHGPQVARSLVSHLCADGAQRGVLVVYTDSPLRDGGPGSARERAAVEHCREAAEAFLGDPEVWVVSKTGYYAADCADAECCPPEGRPLTDLESTEIGAHMVLSGASVADSREASHRIVVADGPARRRAARAAERWRRRRELALVSADAEADLAIWRSGGLRAWREAMASVEPGEGAPSELEAPLLGRLAAALESVPVRDAVLVSLVPGTEDLAEQTASGDPGDDTEARTSAAIGAIVDPQTGLPPDEETSRRARAVLEGVVAHGRAGDQAPALTLLALVAWWDGDGGLAGDRLSAALDADPGYRLALLLARAVGAGVPPGWVRQQL